MSSARDRAIERLAAILMDASAEGYGALRRTVTEAEEIGASTLARSDATTHQGMAERAREVMRAIGLVAVDPALVADVVGALSRGDEPYFDLERTTAALLDSIAEQQRGGQ